MSNQQVIIGNNMDVLRGMPSESIDCVVTSPPYWALRDYGSDPVIWGGRADCEHDWVEHREPARGRVGVNANVGANRDSKANNRGHPTITNYCAKCGAWRGQLGLEPSPHEYIEHLVGVFDEVMRILKPTGACWVNLGDTYNGNKKGNTDTDKNRKAVNNGFCKQTAEGIGDKSLVMIPARFAIAMCDHGWILRNKVIWHKPNVMPQSCSDRFTVDYEEFFFFTKKPTYYFKQVKEANAQKLGNMRNVRTTWSIPTQASKEEHCAMFPKALIETPIKACTPPGGVVLDPFCGSGTVLQYCFEHDIDAVGIEINPAYRDMIRKRARIGQSRLGDYEGVDA